MSGEKCRLKNLLCVIFVVASNLKLFLMFFFRLILVILKQGNNAIALKRCKNIKKSYETTHYRTLQVYIKLILL